MKIFQQTWNLSKNKYNSFLSYIILYYTDVDLFQMRVNIIFVICIYALFFSKLSDFILSICAVNFLGCGTTSGV